MNSAEAIILRPEHTSLILDFEQAQAQSLKVDPQDWQLQSWQAPWREESLNHYLPLGWSFAVLQEKKIIGYTLAQPFIFCGGLTQSLWVEYLSGLDQSVQAQLIETLYRWSREKHLQRLLFSPSLSGLNLNQLGYKPTLQQMFEIKTARFNN